MNPVASQERIASIDVLRGVALLGILLMNIQDFGLPGRAYENPLAAGGAEGANLGYWFANQMFFEGKMRAIFTMLFGASFLVLTGRAEGRGIESQLQMPDIYYRRTIWLIVFGMVHAYFVWTGDILFEYGMAGLFLFPLRKLSAKRLAVTAGVILMLATLKPLYDGFDFLKTKREGVEALAAEKAGKKLTWKQEQAKEKWEGLQKDRKLDPEKIQKDINQHRLGYWANFEKRSADVWANQANAFYQWGTTDVVPVMLLGMALFKWGVFGAGLPVKVYARMVILGYGLGVPVNWYVAMDAYGVRWDPLREPWWGWLVYDYGRVTVALGHIGLVMLICQKGWLTWLTRRLGAVGQMALTNYLLTSVVMTFYFNGYGFSQFGKLERHQLLYVAAAMWTVNLLISKPWLARYRFGPMEWLWRSLTYWEKQPWKIEEQKTEMAHA